MIHTKINMTKERRAHMDTAITKLKLLRKLLGNMISKGSHDESNPTSNNHHNIGKEGTLMETTVI